MGWEGYFGEAIFVNPELVREFWKSPEVTAKEVKGKVLNTEDIVSKATISTTISCAQSGLTQEDNKEVDLGGLEVILDILMRADTRRDPKWVSLRMKDEARVLR